MFDATITTDAKDLAGNALANNFGWSFTTGSTAGASPLERRYQQASRLLQRQYMVTP